MTEKRTITPVGSNRRETRDKVQQFNARAGVVRADTSCLFSCVGLLSFWCFSLKPFSFSSQALFFNKRNLFIISIKDRSKNLHWRVVTQDNIKCSSSFLGTGITYIKLRVCTNLHVWRLNENTCHVETTRRVFHVPVWRGYDKRLCRLLNFLCLPNINIRKWRHFLIFTWLTSHAMYQNINSLII